MAIAELRAIHSMSDTGGAGAAAQVLAALGTTEQRLRAGAIESASAEAAGSEVGQGARTCVVCLEPVRQPAALVPCGACCGWRLVSWRVALQC